MILSESDSDDQELEEDNFVIPCNMKMSSAILLEGKAGKDVYQFTSGMLIMIYLFFRHSDTAICKHHPWYSVRSWRHPCKSNSSYKTSTPLIPTTHFSYQLAGMLIMIDLCLSWWHPCKSNSSYKMPVPRTHFSDDSWIEYTRAIDCCWDVYHSADNNWRCSNALYAKCRNNDIIILLPNWYRPWTRCCWWISWTRKLEHGQGVLMHQFDNLQLDPLSTENSDPRIIRRPLESLDE